MPSMELVEVAYNPDRYEAALTEYNAFMRQELLGVGYATPPADDIEAHVKKIFKASFPLSNGSPLAQFLSQAIALEVLVGRVGEEPVIDIFDNIKLQPEEFYPPKRHVMTRQDGRPLDSQRLDERIPQIWSIYEDIARNLDNTKEVTETEEMPGHDWIFFKSGRNLGIDKNYIWDQICLRDVHYMTHGRPNATTDAVKYKSTVKAQILDGVTTGSDELDIACLLVRASVKHALHPDLPDLVINSGRVVRRGIARAAAVWELRHDAPGEFYPEDFIQFLARPALASTVSGDGWEFVQAEV